MARPEPGLSLYLHIPFCTDKCLYCDFFSVPRAGVPPTVMQRVVDETILQARRFLEAAGEGTVVETIFVGGGTPSCLPPRDLDRLLGEFKGLGPLEWTVEANPETLTEAFLDSCSRAGVTRLSVGIQSLNTRHLETLRRHASREQALVAIGLLKKQWRGEVNLDFITGIPGQTVADVYEDIAVSGNGWPHHVSLYQLTVEPGTPLGAMVNNGTISLNSGEHDEDLWLSGRDELLRRGYFQYEVSNFCLPGKECRHNLHYWHLDPYVGAGPGAVSTMPSAWAARAARRPELAAAATVVRFSAPRDIQAFLAGRDHFWGVETEVVSPSNFLLECLMMGLRLADGVPQTMLTDRFGKGFTDLFPGLWEKWTGQGYARPPGESLRLTTAGLLILDHLLAELMDALPQPDLGDPVHWPT